MGRASIAYTNRDYESIREELLSKIPQLTDRWTDFNASDVGVVLLDLFCAVGDMLSYYLDAQAAEAFLPTARQRQSVIDLCKLIGYRLDAAVSSTTLLRFSLPVPLDQSIVIPSATACRALLIEGHVDFETDEEGSIPHGSLWVDIPARQGVRRSQTFTSTGLPFQRLRLLGEIVAQGTIGVSVAGDAWTEVGHFQDSTAGDRHFLVDLDALDVSSILLGDGQAGAVVPQGVLINVEYLQTVGELGNLGVGRIKQLLNPIYLGGVQVSVSVTNPVPATGGRARETLEQARRQAPAELRTLWKAVTLEDYQALSTGFPGVAKARVLDTNACQNIRYYNVQLAIAPNGGGRPSALLKRDLAAFLEARKVITVEINLFDPIYRPVNIDAEVYAWPTEVLENVRTRIEGALSDMLSFDRVSFGQTVHVSDLVAVLDGVRGVSYLKLYSPQQDIVLRPGEIPVLGNIHLDMHRAG